MKRFCGLCWSRRKIETNEDDTQVVEPVTEPPTAKFDERDEDREEFISQWLRLNATILPLIEKLHKDDYKQFLRRFERKDVKKGVFLVLPGESCTIFQLKCSYAVYMFVCFCVRR